MAIENIDNVVIPKYVMPTPALSSGTDTPDDTDDRIAALQRKIEVLTLQLDGLRATSSDALNAMGSNMNADFNPLVTDAPNSPYFIASFQESVPRDNEYARIETRIKTANTNYSGTLKITGRTGNTYTANINNGTGKLVMDQKPEEHECGYHRSDSIVKVEDKNTGANVGFYGNIVFSVGKCVISN